MWKLTVLSVERCEHRIGLASSEGFGWCTVSSATISCFITMPRAGAQEFKGAATAERQQGVRPGTLSAQFVRLE